MTTSDHPSQAGRRRRLLVLLMGAPMIVAALGVTALEAWRFYRPNAPLFVTPSAMSLAEAIARDDVDWAYEFIRAGQDSNALVTVSHPILTGGRSARLSPLSWAVATGADRSLSMLLGFGAGADATTLRQAHCLAERLGHEGLARQLEVHNGAPFQEPCPAPEDAGGARSLEALGEPERDSPGS